MGLSFDQLIDPPTKEEWRALELLALQGVGFVSQSGFSPGRLSASGTPTDTYSIRAKVVTAGSLGVAQVQLSTDAGVTYGSATTIPGSGILAVSGTGVTLTFTNGEAGAADAFVLDDVYALEVSVSSLPVTSWQPGSVPLTVAELLAQVAEDFGALILAIAKGGLLEKAEGDWLHLLGENVYGLEALAGSVAEHLVVFTSATGVGPFSITDGQLWVASASGLRFNTQGPFTIPASGSVQVTVRAERKGAAYNVGNNTITQMVTAIAGVSVLNPDPGSGTSITVQGSDDESDENYRSRCRARWPSLGTGATAEVFDLWARTATSEVTRTLVQPSASVEGEVDVYLAGASGPVSGGAVTTVEDYLAPRLVLGTTANVQAATSGAYTVEATVYVRAGYEAQVAAQCEENLDRLNRETAIGGTIYVSNIIEELSTPTGVRNVEVVDPAADVVLGATEVGVLTQDLTFVTV